MVRAGLNGDFTTARELHFRFMDLVELLFIDGNPAGIKAILDFLGICGQELRLPLVPATKPTLAAIEKIVVKLRENGNRLSYYKP